MVHSAAHARTSEPAGGPVAVQSVARAFGLIEILAEQGGMMGVSQLSAASGLAPSTIHRLARTLVELGYLRQEQSRQYSLGPRLMHLCESADRMHASWARPHLSGLVDAIGESANLAVLSGENVTFVANVPSHFSVRSLPELGKPMPLHCTAVGKVILAHLPTVRSRELLSVGALDPYTEHTITDERGLTTQLAESRERGYAIDDGEHEIGVRCIAVPVPDTATPTAISVSGPIARMGDDVLERAVALMTSAAKALGADLSSSRVGNSVPLGSPRASISDAPG